MKPIQQNRSFWLLLVGQATSSMGDILYSVAVLSFAYATTGSVLGTASIMILTTLTRLLASFLAVQVIDRLPFRTLMISADIVRGLAVGLLGLTSLYGRIGMPMIYAVTFIAAFAGAFFTPARAAILPTIVAPTELVRANGLIAAVVQVVQTVGWAGGALFVAAVGGPVAILINAVSFGFSALTIYLMDGTPAAVTRSPSLQREGALARLRAGWNEVWSNRVVRDITAMDGLENLANVIWTSPMMLAFTLQVLQVGEEWWGYQSAAYFVGTIMGGVVATAAAGWLSRKGGWTIFVSSASFALLTAWYAMSQNAWLVVLLCVAFGPFYQVRDVVQASMLQASINPQVIGRAFATREMLLMAFYSPAMAAMSLLADVAGLRAAYLVGAGLYAVVALFALNSVPIRTYRMVPDAPTANQR